jgi:hypothetical protein
MVAQHARQSIVGNATTQMVHVVNANIGGQPAQDNWQVVVRAAMQCGLVQFPSVVFCPNRILELVLDVEQPNSNRCSKQCDRQMHEHEGADSETNLIVVTTSKAIAALVAMVLSQGPQPERI